MREVTQMRPRLKKLRRFNPNDAVADAEALDLRSV